MAAKKRTTKPVRKSVKRTTPAHAEGAGFSDDERAAMRERAQELRVARSGASAEAMESAVLEKIAAMATSDRAMAERLHAIIKSAAPSLSAKLWYGMPSYAKNGKVVCFFQGAQKFKARYSTLGFSDQAALDEGNMWPTSFALKEMTAAEESSISALVKRAVS